MVKVVERKNYVREEIIPREALAVIGLLKRKKKKILKEYLKFRKEFNKS